MYSLNPCDDIQSHILGVIAGLMKSYSLNPAQVQARYEYIMSLSPDDITNSYIESETTESSSDSTLSSELSDSESLNNPFENVGNGMRWGDLCYDEEPPATNQQEATLLFVTTRREFCAAMTNGTKICPRYSNCSDQHCTCFHIDPKYICPHVTRGSYCDTEGCDLIVIRPCRKGKRCNDPDCSFRHR